MYVVPALLATYNNQQAHIKSSHRPLNSKRGIQRSMVKSLNSKRGIQRSMVKYLQGVPELSQHCILTS